MQKKFVKENLSFFVLDSIDTIKFIDFMGLAFFLCLFFSMVVAPVPVNAYQGPNIKCFGSDDCWSWPCTGTLTCYDNVVGYQVYCERDGYYCEGGSPGTNCNGVARTNCAYKDVLPPTCQIEYPCNSGYGSCVDCRVTDFEPDPRSPHCRVGIRVPNTEGLEIVCAIRAVDLGYGPVGNSFWVLSPSTTELCKSRGRVVGCGVVVISATNLECCTHPVVARGCITSSPPDRNTRDRATSRY